MQLQNIHVDQKPWFETKMLGHTYCFQPKMSEHKFLFQSKCLNKIVASKCFECVGVQHVHKNLGTCERQHTHGAEKMERKETKTNKQY